METPWLLNVPCCLSQILLTPATLANIFVYDLQKTLGIALTLGSFFLSNHQSGDEMLSTTLF